VDGRAKAAFVRGASEASPVSTLASNTHRVDKLSALTKRRQEVATLACNGLSNRTIAEQLGLSEGTVKVHLHTIYETLGIHSRTQMIALRGKPD